MPPSSRGGRRRGHPSCLDPGRLSGTVCGMLLLCEGLAVALVNDAFPFLTLLVWGQSYCLCPCFPQTKHSLLSYRRLRSAFTLAAVAFSRESCSSAARPCGLVPAAAIDLESLRFAVLPAFSIIGLNYSLVRLLLGNNVEQRVRVMRYEIETHLFLTLRRNYSSGSIPAAIVSTST